VSGAFLNNVAWFRLLHDAAVLRQPFKNYHLSVTVICGGQSLLIVAGPFRGPFSLLPVSNDHKYQRQFA
jgi:hypothetical protein